MLEFIRQNLIPIMVVISVAIFAFRFIRLMRSEKQAAAKREQEAGASGETGKNGETGDNASESADGGVSGDNTGFADGDSEDVSADERVE